MISKEQLDNIWNYYCSLESDMENTSRFVDPSQKDVFSFEFLKIIILTCAEIDNVFQLICQETPGANSGAGNIGQYKSIILKNYPKIVDSKVSISRIGETYSPFSKWDSSQLDWWDAYTDIKHHRLASLEKATCWNAICALSALYILIHYLSRIIGIELFVYNTHPYIDSEYSYSFVAAGPMIGLPDFPDVPL